MKVSELKRCDFNSLSLAQKIEIKDGGRPMPSVNILEIQPACKSHRPYMRTFDLGWYEKVYWLCACEDEHRLYCFVCLLFGGSDCWSKEGVYHLKQLVSKINKHEKSTKHQHNAISFQLLGTCSISEFSNSAYKESIRVHNDLVKKNRVVMSKIIDVLKLCGTWNLPLRNYDESSNTSNKDFFLELLEYNKNVDPLFQSYFEDVNVFKDTSKSMQNQLLDCILQVCRESIAAEIRESSFVTCIVDTTDLTSSQIVMVLRYELKGKIHERFWGVFNAENTIQGLSNCILKELQPLLEYSPEKLIALTYGGHLEFVNGVVENVYVNAKYMYYYGNQLNEILEKATSQISSVNIFFQTIKGISVFFSNSPERTAALDRTCSARIPSPCETRWNFRSMLVHTIFENKDSILECFENIECGVPIAYSHETVYQAAGFVKWLKDYSFIYWLKFFNDVMPLIDMLYRYAQLQKIEADVVKMQKTINSYEAALLNVRSRIPTTKFELYPSISLESPEEDLHTVARKICDCLLTHVKTRFAFKSHFYGAKLFFAECYEQYKRSLPVTDIEDFCDAFTMIDRDKLASELRLFYARPEFLQSGCLKLLNYLAVTGLDTSMFQEIKKALKILVTLPMSTCETERCVSPLKLINSYLRNSIGEDRLTTLGMLYVEEDMVKEIPDFNGKVIDKFSSEKGQRMEFCYKEVNYKAGAKTEDITSCVSESLSSEDSNHSELLHSGDPLALEDDSRPGTSSSVDFASFAGTSGVNPLPSSSFATVEMPPPRLPPSRGASPALQSMSVTQSLPLPAQNRGGERETSSEERVTPGSVGNGLNNALLETNRLDDALQRLEGISDKVNGLSGAEDNFDNFGKYVASLLRGLPTSKVADVQQQVINLILSSHISPDAPSGDLNSSSSAGIAPSCSTSETLPTPKPPPPPPPPQTHSPAQSTPTSALQSNSKSTSQTKKGEKRPHAHDESPSGVGNKQVKLEDTEQIDATLKRLEEISDRVNQLGGRDDSFDVFGKYAASILRCLPPQRAMELQKEVVNLILREQGDSMTQTARRFHAAATVAVS